MTHLNHHHTYGYFCNSGGPSPSTYADSEESLSSQFHAAILDNEFLLRAALTHDWDTLITFCQFLEDIFTLSVPDRRTQWQRNRITAAKQQLVSRDQWGNTALHAACYNLAPARVVRALLQAASACRPTPLQIHQVLSRDHSTPLLVACATGASLQVIEALLDPPAGLIKAGATVMIPDQQGATPLTELAVNYELQRKSPIYVHTSRPLDQVRLIRYDSAKNGSDAGTEAGDALLDSFQSKLEALLQAAWWYSFPSQNMISMVHGLAHVAASCPPVVTRLVLREYPHMIGFADRRGTLPLHLVISNPPPTNTRGTTIENDNDDHHQQQQTKNITAALSRHAYCVEQLLQAYPSSASFEVPYFASSPKETRQVKKRSPFLHAIASGCFWHTSPGGSNNSSLMMMAARRSTSNNSNENNNKKRGPLHILWQANPEDLSRSDPVTGLYPVILAAIRGFERSRNSKYPVVVVNNKSTQVEVQEHILQVDTIYNLLRLHPQVLEECCRNL